MAKLQRLMMCVEGYSRALNIASRSREAAREKLDEHLIQHGDLAKDYADNPDSDVSEVLMTSIWNYEDERIVFQLWCTPFRYTDGGLIVWGEDVGPLGDEGEWGVEGDISAAGKRVMR